MDLIVTTPERLQELVEAAVTNALNRHRAENSARPQTPTESEPVPYPGGYVDSKEAARILGLEMPTLYQRIKKIPHRKIGGLLRFKVEELYAYMDQRRRV